MGVTKAIFPSRGSGGEKRGLGCSRLLSGNGPPGAGFAARGDSGQMTVELAAALPVLLIVAMIAVNALTFFGECAVFDRATHEAIRVHACSPAYGQAPSQSCALIEADIRAALGGGHLDVAVAYAPASRNLDRYTAVLTIAPSLFGMGLRSEVLGVSMPQLTHTVEYVVDSYKPGLII